MFHSAFRPASDVFGELNRLQSVLDQVFRPQERAPIRALAGASFPAVMSALFPVVCFKRSRESLDHAVRTQPLNLRWREAEQLTKDAIIVLA